MCVRACLCYAHVQLLLDQSKPSHKQLIRPQSVTARNRPSAPHNLFAGLAQGVRGGGGGGGGTFTDISMDVEFDVKIITPSPKSLCEQQMSSSLMRKNALLKSVLSNS